MSLKLIENFQEAVRDETEGRCTGASRNRQNEYFYETEKHRRALDRRFYVLYSAIVIAFMLGVAV